MGKVIKVIDLLNESAKENKLLFKKAGDTYKNSLWTFLYEYLNKKMSFEEIVEWLNSKVEIIDDEIDIHSIEEFDVERVGNIVRYKAEKGNYTVRVIDVDIMLKMNELIRAVKQLENK